MGHTPNEEKLKLLEFNVWILKVFSLWPDPKSDTSKTRFLKDYIHVFYILPAALPIAVDLSYQIRGEMNNLTGVTENLIALADIVGMNFMCICFLEKRVAMRHLIARLQSFQQYGDRAFAVVTEKRVVWLTKFILIYALLGNSSYICTPLMQITACHQMVETLSAANKSINGIHCGIITRCRYPFDMHKPFNYGIVFAHQCSICFLVTISVLMMTMFLCGILMHTVEELKHFKTNITEVMNHSSDEMSLQRDLIQCVKHHIDIMEFAKIVDDSFSKMMLVHMTLTSGIISVLLFEVLMVSSFGDSLRFGLHLCGWLVLLYLTCHFGQMLVDESFSVALCLYSTNWFETPASVRHDILFMIMRSQQTLKLTAASLGTISLESFLKIMSTAYSYFTLLLNIRE